MNRSTWRTATGFLICLALSFGGAGCATTAMKGTPFFSGEYSKRLGPPEDRVNLWPILYYRDPALSVLWPLIDYTDDYFAFRPLFSVYGLDKNRREYNVLWPLTHFEEGKGDNWILPFFWGDRSFFGENYAIGFPLYWHFGHPLSEKGGMDSLFPAWCYRTERDGYDLHLAWPFMEVRSLGKEPQRKEGWRIWPAYGSYRERDEHYRFVVWPLAQFWWNDKRDESTQCVIPLWYREKTPGHSLFLSLPYSRGSDAKGSSWWLVPPLAYGDSDNDKSHLITPVYWRGRDTKADSAWDAVLPLFYWQRDGKGATFASLPVVYGRHDPYSVWLALPILSGGVYGPNGGSTWWFAGIGHRSTSENGKAWHVFPLCYSLTESNRRLFLSLPWSGGESSGGNAWSVVPPVLFHSRSAAGAFTVTPLYMRGKETGGERREWSALMPLFYRRTSDRGTAFVTPLFGVETDKEKGKRWMTYPLLTGGRIGEGEGSVWALGPVFHAAWDKESTTHHLFPAYYWNGKQDTFVSIPYCQWKSGESWFSAAPPLLSLYSRRETRSDLWTGAGLIHWSWGKDAGTRHVLPVYMGNVKEGWHVTPLIASWRHGVDGDGVAVPPLLSWYMSDQKRSDLWFGGPLAHFSWGSERGGSHVFPVAYWNTRTSTYLSPFYATWTPDPDARKTLIPPALGYYERNHADRDLWLALGLFHMGETKGREDSGRGHLFPLYLYDDGMFLTPLFGWNNGGGDDFVYPLTPLLGFWRNEKSGMWLFPLFSRCREVKSDKVGGNVLWGFYSFERDDGRFTFFPFFSYRRWDQSGTNVVLRVGQSAGYDVNYLLFGRCLNERNVLNRYVGRDGGSAVPVLSDRQERVNRFFPLWRYAGESWDDGREETSDFSLLLLLYDHRTEVQAVPRKGQPARYVRSRILYHLWHYERTDDAVSVDLFPAITYDRRDESFRKFSFLWRGFRYERSKGQRAVDLLFLPIWRTKWAGEG